MIGENYSKSILGLSALFAVGTLIGWSAVKFDDHLIDTIKLKSSSIIIIEGLVLSVILVIYLITSSEGRNNLLKDVKKLGIKEWSSFILLSLVGIYIGILINDSLKHWETSEFRIINTIVKLVLGGLLFFTFTGKSYDYRKVLAFTLLAVGAVYFTMV